MRESQGPGSVGHAEGSKCIPSTGGSHGRLFEEESVALRGFCFKAHFHLLGEQTGGGDDKDGEGDNLAKRLSW